MPSLAYSYLRFSSLEQAKGDSFRRQTELRDVWLSRNGIILDTSLTFRDEGKSAFSGKHRTNPDRHALALFLQLVEQGKINRGSYLIVENLDRLSREHIRPALTLLLNLIEAGIKVVQLLPVEQVFDEGVEPMTLMMAIMELSRGHSESRMKSERVGAAWKRKKEKAAEGIPLTRQVPAWLTVKDGVFEIVKEKADAVRRIYRMAVDGHGLGVITKTLNTTNVPPIARGKKWARSYVAKLLASRAVVGEYQPHKGHSGAARKPDGPPIPDYYPSILSEEQWFAARAALADRRNKPGRIGRRVNLFTGLLRNAHNGGTLQVLDKGVKSSGPALVSYDAVQGVPGAAYISFPLTAFEEAVLPWLRQIDPRELLVSHTAAEDQEAVLEGRLDKVRNRIERAKAALDGADDIRAVIDKLREWEGEEKALTAALSAVRQEKANPLTRAWAECHTLLDALAAAPDPAEARTRLRAAIRRIVSGVWCVFLAEGQDRVAAIQVWFKGGGHRDYLVYHRRGHGNATASRKSKSWVTSVEFEGEEGGLDLRRPEHAHELERVLAPALVQVHTQSFARDSHAAKKGESDLAQATVELTSRGVVSPPKKGLPKSSGGDKRARKGRRPTR